MIYKKHFSIEEANGLIPQLRDYFEEIFSIQKCLKKERKQKELVTQNLSRNGGWNNSALYLENSFKVSKILDKILKTGAVVKDLEKGLVDFPHISEGLVPLIHRGQSEKEVFLCWEVGEKEVLYWHDLESGYKGRKSLYLDKDV